MQLGKLLFLRHKNLIAHLMIIWLATGDHMEPVSLEKYMAIKDDLYEEVMNDLDKQEYYSGSASQCSRSLQPRQHMSPVPSQLVQDQPPPYTRVSPIVQQFHQEQ